MVPLRDPSFTASPVPGTAPAPGRRSRPSPPTAFRCNGADQRASAVATREDAFAVSLLLARAADDDGCQRQRVEGGVRGDRREHALRSLAQPAEPEPEDDQDW